ncbi:MAG TPA: DUF1499 domain-containing protein [Candidatus Binatia bacterium]|nr:DUF1499 domain-containing protein [Candidatus Binatia bacterium]
MSIGLIAAIAFVVGPVLAWLGIVSPLHGFVVFALGGLLALLAGVAALIRAIRGRGVGAGGVAAMLAAVVFVFIAVGSRGAPRINDYTTDLADPPGFQHATTLSPNAGRDMTYPPPFAAVQQACCADLGPAHLAVLPAEAFTRAQAAAARMPSWTVTHADPASGTIEAVATSRLFHFQDDIAIRVRPDGNGSRVDVRSKSRDGQGDMGVNAARIRTYVATLGRS